MNAPSTDHTSGFGLGRDNDTPVEELSAPRRETRSWIFVTASKPEGHQFTATGLSEFYRKLEETGEVRDLENDPWAAAYKTATGKIKVVNHHHPEMVARVCEILDDPRMRDALNPATVD